MKPRIDDILSALSLLEKSNGEVYGKGSITPDELNSELTKANLVIPGCLYQWLLRVNGIVLPGADIYGIGLRAKAGFIDKARNQYNKYEDRGIIPIAGDGCGNDYVIESTKGDKSPVFFAGSESSWSMQFIVASNVELFLMFVILSSHNPEDQKWPFDREYVLKHDPDIVKCGFPLPWDG